ncbi:hypothetical protein I6A84_18245 [Frankia sp. CNm7]|uniref:Uncharacterized protein n=1 Tax=Frankia nepalensis TaxID=1836974 RepID=A0A937RMH7_9ACTN|nr:hypothetical protein [Frankia nepalensis]MBL7501861.1 hypothetical protein [Frankia nepalensis]MBL7513803.1 hypothetical protein [Frankia nepalensis]MBL7519982.1 hypothetical protein [Frankia nepalensis]MBL7629108.1 hypothetical protein [Frankia nepalensis]
MFVVLGVPALTGAFVFTAVVLYLLQRAPSFRELPAFGQALWALAMAGGVALLLGGALLGR